MRDERTKPMQRAWRTVAATWNEGQNDELGPVDVERARPLIPHADRNSDAEYALYQLPGRFQRFVEECLFVNERVLAFAPWTEATTETRRHRLARLVAFGGRQAVEGARLVMTWGVSRNFDDSRTWVVGDHSGMTGVRPPGASACAADRRWPGHIPAA